jgi:hypothetical protein
MRVMKLKIRLTICHAVRAVHQKPSVIRLPRSGAPPVRPEAFEAIWSISGRN